MDKSKGRNIKSDEQKRYRECCFTSFVCDDTINWWHDWSIDPNTIITYMIIQGEFTKEQKKHIQGYAQFKKQVTRSQIQLFFGDKVMHVEPRWAEKAQQAIDYCMEEKHGRFHDHVEYGKKKQQGKRNDLIALRDKIKSGITVKNILHTSNDEKELNLCVKYERVLSSYQRDVYEYVVKKELYEENFTTITWYPWQKELIDEIENKKLDTRKIVWVHEQIGNVGKSHLTEYLMCTNNVFLITGGKQADILYGYENQPIIIYDLSRTSCTNMDHLYNTMEHFKNGKFFSTKFESRQRMFRKPHVIVMANIPPERVKCSLDRWDVRTIDNKTKRFIRQP